MGTRELVCIIDPIHAVGAERMAQAHEIIAPTNWYDHPKLSETSVIVVRTSPIDAALICSLPGLKAIVKHGAGVDNIDIPAASSRGVIVANTPGGNNSTAVAEGAAAMMLSLLRRTREMDTLVRGNRWNERWGVRLGDLTGARVGLIGFGRIARCLARICGAGFGAEIAAFDSMVSPEEMRALGVEPMPLDKILTRDVISIHTPLTEGTRGLIGAEQLSLMPPHAILVNCSRGGIVDEHALAEALRSGRIAGAGIDVFEAEPPAHDNPLIALPNCLLSPHVAGVTEAGMRDMALNVASVVDIINRGERPDTLLNPEIFA